METIKPGSILSNNITNKQYGVLVNILPNNKLIVFRLDKNTHPIFSKFDLHSNVCKTGVINENQHNNLKSALLRHYRTYNLTNSEKKLLEPLMNFAFPLGIPEYDPQIHLPERDLALMDLHTKLQPGNKLFINTPNDSCYSHLNDKTLTILQKTPEGIWINNPSNDNNINNINSNIYFLFYKNKEIPTFGGISRILPVIVTENLNPSSNSNGGDSNNIESGKLDDTLMEMFNNLNEKNELTTTMQFNGEKIKVLPNSKKIIFPEIYQHMSYNPELDTFTAESGTLTPELIHKLGNKVLITGKDIATTINNDNEAIYSNNKDTNNSTADGSFKNYVSSINEDGELVFQQSGGGKGHITTEELMEQYLQDERLETIMEDEFADQNIDDQECMTTIDVDMRGSSKTKKVKIAAFDDDEEEDINMIIENKSKSLKDIATTESKANGENDDSESLKKPLLEDGNETDYDEEDFDIVEEDELQEGDVYQKIKRVEVSELEKVYKESIIKGDIFKYKIEKIPKLRRNDKVIRDKINKKINILSLLKYSILDKNEENTLRILPPNYKPLVDKYIKGDFTNKFLIPLVINRKKLYLDKNKKYKKNDFDNYSNIIKEDFYEDISKFIDLQEKKNVVINNDVFTNNIYNELNPRIADQQELGIMIRLGEGLEPTDYRKMFQDTLTIRYCDKPIKCQSFSMSTVNFDYQINLGPVGRFIGGADKEEIKARKIEDEEDENLSRVDKDILYQDSKFKIFYRGDNVNVIGFVRPPISYFNMLSRGVGLNSELYDEKLLIEMYEAKYKNKEVVIINLEDINLEVLNDDFEEEEKKFNIANNPEHFVLFLLPNNIVWNDIGEQIKKIIPDINDIVKLYIDQNDDSRTIDNIYNVMSKFDYDNNNLSIESQNLLLAENEKLLSDLEAKAEKIDKSYQKYLDNKEAAEEKTKKEGKSEKEKKEIAEKLKLITDDLLDEVTKYYFTTYTNKDTDLDNDLLRLKWFNNSTDNGRLLMKTMMVNYLKQYQESHNLEKLEGDLIMLKEKYNMALNTSQTTGDGQNSLNSNQFCKSRGTTGPNIIKYPTLERLEQDNGKVAVDSDGNVIMQGDYAIVIHPNGNKELFKREVISNVDLWVKEDLNVLMRIINEKKNSCMNPEMKLDDKDSKCIFDMEMLKCDGVELFAELNMRRDMEVDINELNMQVEYLKSIPKLLAGLNSQIKDDRKHLINIVNNEKRLMKFYEEENKKLEEEISKTIAQVKPCIHFDVTNYFFKISGYAAERYYFAQSIFKNFENEEMSSLFRTIDEQDNNKNFTYCNICNQKLLCNHFKLGVAQIEESGQVNFDELIRIYGVLIDHGYNCKVCSEFIENTVASDNEGYQRGEDAFKNKTRDVKEEVPIIEKQMEYINNLINNAILDEQVNPDLAFKVNIFKMLKRLSGLDLLSMQDEIEMINFLKSYNFISKNDAIELIIRNVGVNAPPALIQKNAYKLYNTLITCDIAARFLIILQTTNSEYNILNKFCNSNIIGYPLINDLTARDGINYLLCIFSQMAVLNDYTFLVDFKESYLLNRINKQVEEDSYVKNKIFNAINQKSETIDHIMEFNNYSTNYWQLFMPKMMNSGVSWKPEKILNRDNLKELSYKNYKKMLEVGKENTVYDVNMLMYLMNKIIENSEKLMVLGINGSCCSDALEMGKSYNYYNAMFSRDSTIKQYYNSYFDVNDIFNKIVRIIRSPHLNMLYNPLYKPSQKILSFNMNVTENEIRDIYLKFIDSGINKGKLHVFDNYGRCLLSNEKKQDIKQKSYIQSDFNRIEASIVNANSVAVPEITEAIDKSIFEKKKLDELISKMPKLKIFAFLEDYINKIKEEEDVIFGSGNKAPINVGGGGSVKKSTFDIHKHISLLNSQIEEEIISLIQKITTTDKMVNKYKNILSNMGDFKKHYGEYKDSHSMMESLKYRYIKKIENLKYDFKYLYDVVVQIKNGELNNQLTKENIRPQFREFIRYGSNVKLFQTLSKSMVMIKKLMDCLVARDYTKLFTYEFVSSLMHYICVISLQNLFEELSIKKIGKKNAKDMDIKFKLSVKESREDEIMPSMNMDVIDMEAADENDIDLVESYEIKTSNNMKMITEFVVSYMEKVNQVLEDYDELTPINIKSIIDKHDQKNREATIRAFELLNTEGYERMHSEIMYMLKVSGKLQYKDITEYLKEQLGDEDLKRVDDNDDYVEESGDVAGDGGETGAVNQLGFDNYEMGQMGQVFAMDDNEEMDAMDYDAIGVDE